MSHLASQSSQGVRKPLNRPSDHIEDLCESEKNVENGWDGNERKMRKKRGDPPPTQHTGSKTPPGETRKPRTRREKVQEKENCCIQKNKTNKVTQKKQTSKTAAPSRAEPPTDNIDIPGIMERVHKSQGP